MMNFSIITVCYNDYQGLIRTYQSIRTQTYANFEWIVIDGASKDETPHWLQQLDDNRLKWTSEPDKGIFDAMNKGIAKASGDYLLFMNAGDEINGMDMLFEIDRTIAACEHEPYFVYGDALDISVSGQTFLKPAKSYTTFVNTMFTSHQAMLFNRAFGENYKIAYPLHYQYTADYAYISEFIKRITDPKHILRLNFPICKFFLGGTNEIHRYKALKEDYKIRVQVIGIGRPHAGFLYLLHLTHTFLKKNLPFLTSVLRYKR